MLTNDEQQRESRCNDLGGNSSEEDNEKQNVRSLRSSSPLQRPQRLQQSPSPGRPSPGTAATDGEDASSKLLYHPVVVSTVLNIDFENYMVHDSQNGGSAKQQRSCPSSCQPSAVLSLPFRFHEPHREFFIVERCTARPRSASLTDNIIDGFRTRRDDRLRASVNRSNDDLSGVSGHRMPPNAELSTVTELVGSVVQPITAVAPAAKRRIPANCAERSCDLHRRGETMANSATAAVPSSTPLPRGLSDLLLPEAGVMPSAVAGYSFSCARTVSFHALLCSCRLTCCCMCDFLCPAECYSCLHGVCSQFVAQYPCTKSQILRPVNIVAADEVSQTFAI